ncbi:MAG: MBL fold metallo-hydrolase [Gemmatimonadales bacterium]|nr:MAG: MBL fold metallo-hydrolase [Gemmatimonadales bacterium]
MGRLVLLLALGLGACAAPPPPTPAERPSEPAGELEIFVLDVGQGDAILIRTPEGRTILYDGGPSRTAALDHLRELGVESLDLVVASHPHADHIGGLAAVIEAYRPPSVLDNGLPHTTQTYERYLTAVREAGSRLLEPEARTLTLGSVTLDVLPPPGVASWGLNDNSVGIVVRFGEFRMTLGGDAEERQWAWWLDEGHVPEGPVEIHKASHHGSRNGDTAGAISRLGPRTVVIGVGAGNQFGHPHEEALALYRGVGATILRTDRDGTVSITATSDGQFRVTTEDASLSHRDPSGYDSSESIPPKGDDHALRGFTNHWSCFHRAGSGRRGGPDRGRHR